MIEYNNTLKKNIKSYLVNYGNWKKNYLIRI